MARAVGPRSLKEQGDANAHAHPDHPLRPFSSAKCRSVGRFVADTTYRLTCHPPDVSSSGRASSQFPTTSLIPDSLISLFSDYLAMNTRQREKRKALEHFSDSDDADVPQESTSASKKQNMQVGSGKKQTKTTASGKKAAKSVTKPSKKGGKGQRPATGKGKEPGQRATSNSADEEDIVSEGSEAFMSQTSQDSHFKSSESGLDDIDLCRRGEPPRTRAEWMSTTKVFTQLLLKHV
ncbi:hypothetical protein K470DRAFT_148527 [Piedraia hortae CBS 480.64]|uniref:Uncharacterized protein n=1 Tax=Piedraia hortae CBS 480.64 TaxID=1314780 RepID=A0A6A7BRY3_9PEZI|nr:hypothetical protein K470DRAFT_148527 [Piedraia hortae CBS 480.64]